MQTPAFGVAALGLRHNKAQRLKRLLDIEVTAQPAAQQVAHLRRPLGLNQGAQTPLKSPCTSPRNDGHAMWRGFAPNPHPCASAQRVCGLASTAFLTIPALNTGPKRSGFARV